MSTPRRYRYWTDERIIAAIVAWADAHGGIPPRACDWRHATADHPSGGTVCRIGWARAVRCAGFVPPQDRTPERHARFEALLRSGLSAARVAELMGCTRAAITHRFRTRGTTLTAWRAAGCPPLPTVRNYARSA